MITELSREELIEMGAGLRTPYLLQQAGYTLGIAAEEEDEIEGILEEPTLVEEITAARDQVKAATGDRELMEQEAKDLTHRQNAKLVEAKVWRRKVVARAKRAKRRGKKIPEVLTVVGAGSSVPDLTAQVTAMTATMTTMLPALGGARAQALLTEGQTILTELSQADSDQEVARLSTLPQKVADFYAAKAILLTGIKLINDAGQELHADDHAQAARFNLKILHRRGGAREKVEGGGPNKPA